MMAVATVDHVGKCCEADTAVIYISLVVYQLIISTKSET